MTDPPVAGIAGAFVARLAGRPFVYNIRDMYPDMAVGGDIVRPGKWVEHWEKMHRKALKQAARVIVLGDDMRDRILKKGVDPHRVVVVRDGASSPSAMPAQDDPIVREIRGEFSFVVLHAGNLGFYGAWSTLLKAAALLRNEDIGFVFVGDGANRKSLEDEAASLPNVRFLPFRPASELPHVMRAGDLHIVTVKRGLEGVVVPSKLYSTLAAGRPVLTVAPRESDAARIVTENDCGIAVDPDDPRSVADAILQLRSNPLRLEAMGKRAREAASRYTRAAELQRFVGVLEEVALETNGGRHLES
jgi:glycosyltransferase involved in cell wall biosynthesis